MAWWVWRPGEHLASRPVLDPHCFGFLEAFNARARSSACLRAPRASCCQGRRLARCAVAIFQKYAIPADWGPIAAKKARDA